MQGPIAAVTALGPHRESAPRGRTPHRDRRGVRRGHESPVVRRKSCPHLLVSMSYRLSAHETGGNLRRDPQFGNVSQSRSFAVPVNEKRCPVGRTSTRASRRSPLNLKVPARVDRVPDLVRVDGQTRRPQSNGPPQRQHVTLWHRTRLADLGQPVDTVESDLGFDRDSPRAWRR